MKASAMAKTTGKEYFYKVPGLTAPGYMVPASLESDIEDFIDWAPDNTVKLEALSENEDLIRGSHSFLPRMEKLYAMLCSIYACWLEKEAARILRMAEAQEVEICRKLIAPFVSNVHTLALDIQMAQNGKLDRIHKRYGRIEGYRDIISGMRLVSLLLRDANFEKALAVAESIDELRESEYIASLTSHISSESAGAGALADKIVSTYTGKIDALLSGASNASANVVEKKKVVLVDDMPETLVTLGYMLEDYYQVFSFTAGEEALEFAAQKKVDAFILDIDMPDMDGFTLAKKIREKPRQKDAPILFLTGNGTRETLVKALAYAPKAFIVKPASKNIIISKLNECLNP